MGDAVQTPVQPLMKDANPIPDSKNPSFIEEWFNESSLSYEEFKSFPKNGVKGRVKKSHWKT